MIYYLVFEFAFANHYGCLSCYLSQICIKLQWPTPTGSQAKQTIRPCLICSFAIIHSMENSPSLPAWRSVWNSWTAFITRRAVSLQWVYNFCINLSNTFSVIPADIEYLRQTLPEGIENEFFEYLGNLTAHDVTLYAIDEGTVAFPRWVNENTNKYDDCILIKSLITLSFYSVPIIKIEGPLIIVQLLETTLLTLVNYARWEIPETVEQIYNNRRRYSYVCSIKREINEFYMNILWS